MSGFEHLSNPKHVGLVGAALGVIGTTMVSVIETCETARHSIHAAAEPFRRCPLGGYHLVKCGLDLDDSTLAGVIFHTMLPVGIAIAGFTVVKNIVRRLRTPHIPISTALPPPPQDDPNPVGSIWVKADGKSEVKIMVTINNITVAPRAPRRQRPNGAGQPTSIRLIDAGQRTGTLNRRKRAHPKELPDG